MSLLQAAGAGAYLLLGVVLLRNSLAWYLQGRRRGASPTAAAFQAGVFCSLAYAFFFLVEPLLIVAFDRPLTPYVRAMPPGQRADLVSVASLLALLGYLGLWAGRSSPRARAWGERLPTVEVEGAPRSRFYLVLAAFFLATLVGSSRFDLVQLARSPHLRIELTAGKGYWFLLVQAYLAATLFWFADRCRVERASRVLVGALWVFPVGVAIFGGRTDVLQVWLTMLAIRGVLSRRTRLRNDLLVLVLVISFLTGFLVWRRSVQRSRRAPGPSVARTSTTERLVHALQMAFLPYDAFLAYLDLYEDHFRGRLGSGLREISSFAIPRSLDPDRPVRSQALLRELVAPRGRGGNPFTLVGYLHMNLSYLGVILGMYLVGLLCAAAEGYQARNRDREAPTVLVSVFTVRLFPLLIGSFIPWFFNALQFFALLILWCLALGRVRSTRSPSRVFVQPACVVR